MNLITFFGLKVKPKLTRGKGMWNPLNTQVTTDGLVCIRDKDVNCFLIRTNSGYIAIDSGYQDSENTRKALKELGIALDSVSSVFLTHLDIDHAGGVNEGSDILFPKATIYLGTPESKYLSGEYFRKKVLFHNCKLPIRLSGFQTMAEGETITIDGVSVQAIYAFGHTLGHTTYIVNDKWLFSGDCIIANENGGYSFYDFWNADSELNKRSAEKLKTLCEEKQIEKVVTSHSGILNSDEAFNHCSESPSWREKGFVFCKDADEDPYSL